MKSETIRKEVLVDWEYGDVVIKKFSFGDKLRLSAFTTNMSINENEIVKESKNIDTYALTMFTVACGLHSIKDSGNYEYVLKPGSHIDDKLAFINSLDIPYEAGVVILSKIKEFNKEISEDKKKE